MDQQCTNLLKRFQCTTEVLGGEKLFVWDFTPACHTYQFEICRFEVIAEAALTDTIATQLHVVGTVATDLTYSLSVTLSANSLQFLLEIIDNDAL
jgi:hypothetical protein